MRRQDGGVPSQAATSAASPVAARRDASPHPLVESLAVDPEAEGWVGDEVDLLAVHGVVAVGKL